MSAVASSIAGLSVSPVGILDALLPAFLAGYAAEHGPDRVWWLEAEQSDGFVVGRWAHGALELRGSLPDVELDPALLFDLRFAAPGHELRLGRDAGLRGWARVLVDHGGDPALEPRFREQLLLEPGGPSPAADGVFTRIERVSGERTIIPEPWPAAGQLVKVMREHFDEDETGNVRVAAVCLEGYFPAGATQASAGRGV